MKEKFKRILSALLTVLMLLSAVPLTAAAAEDSYDYLTYKIADGEVTIYGYNFSIPKNLVIPSEIEGCPVTAIDDRAFSGYDNIESVTIPDSVKRIGEGAFHLCFGLIDVTIGSGATDIGNDAFSYCIRLSSITVDENNPVYDSRDNCNAIIETETNTLIAGCMNTVIPDGITSIGYDAFYYCTDIENIIIPDSVTSIGDSAFEGCISLESIIIPDSVTSIGGYVFTSCTSLKNVTIPDSVTSIGEYAFESCTGLESITLSENVTSIGKGTFAGCTRLAAITLPDIVESIGNCAFQNCGNLTNIILPAGLTSVGQAAFSNCQKLADITLPYNLASIGEGAFANCQKLTHITIPAGVTNIEEHAFKYCDNLTSVTVDKNNPVYDSRENCNAIIETETNTLIKGFANTIIPDSVTSIGNGAFYGCKNLTGITIPAGVTEIGNNAFYACNNLTNITIPDSVTSIGDSAFSSCTGLTNITISDSVTSIGDSAFSSCIKLTNITIPNQVESISALTFLNCIGLESIIIPGKVTKIGDRAFSGCKNLISVTIPNSVTIIDHSAFASCTSLTDITIPDSLTSIGNYAFQNCSGLTSVTIPDSVTSIGSSAFNNCTSLASVTIPDSVTSIGSSAFKNCTSLASVTIPRYIKNIENYTFYSCNNLTDVYYKDTETRWNKINIADNNAPLLNANVHFNELACDFLDYKIANGEVTITGYNDLTPTELVIPSEIEGYPVTSIGIMALSNFYYLTSVTIPGSVKSIGNAAFVWCENLTSITILDGVQSIGNEAFYTCYSLESITIPDSVVSIGKQAFQYCGSLKYAEIGKGVTSIGGDAFLQCSSLESITVDESNMYYSSDEYGALYNKDKTTLIKYPATSSTSTFNIPDSVTSIGTHSFQNCSGLTSVTIPDSFTNINHGDFSYCISLVNITVDDNNPVYDSRENCNAIIETETNTLICGCQGTVIPDSVTSIDDYAFFYRSDFTNISIPDSVTNIGDSAFKLCSNLSDIYYNGSEKQWNEIEIGSQNEYLLNANIHFICTVTFNPQGGTVNPTTITVERGDSVTLPEAARAGYTFRGWLRDDMTSKITGRDYRPTSDITLYAIWAPESENLIDTDFYQFSNSSDSFSDENYRITPSDFEKLKNYVDAHYNTDYTTKKDELTAEADKAWNGSCYGMAATILLDKYGRIAFRDNFANGAATMSEVGNPKENENIESAINYYHISQFLDYTRNGKIYEKNDDVNDWQKGLKNLVNMADKPVLLVYEYEKDNQLLGHALIIKGCAVTDDGYRLEAYDSRTPGINAYVNISEDYSTCTITGDGIDGAEEATMIQAINDFTKFDYIDIDGPNNDFVLKPAKELSAKTKTNVKVQGVGNVTIRNSKGETLTISNGKVSGTMKILSENLIVYDDADGNPAPVTFSLEVEDSDSFTFESTADEMSVSVLSDDIFASAETTNADTIVITENEGISLSGDDIEYKAYLSLDNDYCDMFKLEGKSDDDIDISYGKNGVRVSGTQSETTTLTVYSGVNDADEYKFDTDCKSVLIADDKSGVKIMGSSKDNGVYDISLLGELKVKVNGLDLIYRENGKIRTIITNGNADKCSYSYTSSNTDVACVDGAGNIVTKGRGRTTITCTITDEYGRTAKNTCTVEVRFTFWQWVIWFLLFGFLWY